MPALLERPKMTRAMYEALKRHIMHEREKKKQEQEQDAMMERLKKERELKKKKEEEDSLTLEQTNDQIIQLEKKLELLKEQKHELFSQLKKVLHQEDETRRKAQQKEQSEMTLSQPVYQHPSLAAASQPVMMHGRPALYKPTAPAPMLTGMKRQRSPSPPPASSSSSYPTYGHSDSDPKYPHTSDSKYSHPADSKYPLGDPKYASHAETKFAHADPKYLPSFSGAKTVPSAHLYTTQHTQPTDFKSSAYQQPSASHLYAANQSFQQQQAAAAAAGTYPSSQAGASKYPAPGQSAFTSYQSPFAQSHPTKALAEQFSAAYPIQRMQQPAYHASIQLQQSLEHAGQKQPAFEDKYKMSQSQIRGLGPSQQPGLITQAMQLQQQQQQQAKSAGSFVQGYPPRSQQAPGANYPTSTTSQQQSSYSNPTSGQGRPGYGGQPHSRYY